MALKHEPALLGQHISNKSRCKIYHALASHRPNHKVVQSLANKDDSEGVSLGYIQEPWLERVLHDIRVLLNPDGQECAREGNRLDEVNRENLVLQSPKLQPRCTPFSITVRLVKMGAWDGSDLRRALKAITPMFDHRTTLEPTGG